MLTKILVFIALANSVLSGPSGIQRPCDFNDLQCIRDVFASNTGCNANVQGSVPAEYIVDVLNLEMPYFNGSIIDRNVAIKNVNLCSVSDFFYNENTATYIMTLDCPEIMFKSDRTQILRGTKQENQYYKFNKTAYASLIQLTVNLNKEDNFDLCSSATFIDAINAKITLEPADSDERSAEFVARLEESEDLNTIYFIEDSKWVADPLLRKYFNNYICDFGCQ